MATRKQGTTAATAEEAERAEEAARTHAEAEENKLDETVPGGRYEVDGQLVDAEGKKVK